MVCVQVADQHHRQCRHSEPVQAGVDGPVVRPGVDEHHPPRLPGREHQRVTLPDVARHDGPAGWRPTRTQHPGGDQNQQEADYHREEQRTDPAGAGEQHDRDDDRGEQPRSGRAARPRDDRPGHRRRPVRHRHEPAHRRAGEPGAPLCGRHRHRRQHRRQHAEHRRRRDRGRRDQVRDHGHQAHAAAQTREQRSRRQARRRGYREHLGDARRYSALPHPGHPPRHDQHECRSREHRQAEPRVGRECRVGDQQPEHRRGERGHGRPFPAECEGQQHHGAHRGRPQHAGRWTGEHDEAEKCRGAQRCGHPRIGAQQAQKPQHRAGDDREIAARDGGQVAEPGRTEVVAQLRRQVAGVAHREPRQQGGRRFGEDRRGAAEAVAQRARGGLPPGCATDVARPAAHPQHRYREVAPGGWGKQALGRDRLPGEQLGPALGRGDQQDPAAAGPPPTRGLRRTQHRGHQHLRRAGPRPTPEERSSRGSSPTTTCRVAAAPCSAAVRTGWSRTITACAVTTSAAASAQPPAATSTARRLRSPPSSRPPARAAPTTPPTGPVCRPSSTTAHAAPAAGTSRRSGGRVGTASAPAVRSGGPGRAARAGACSGTDPAPARRVLDRTGSGARGAVTPAPAHAAARAAARRCPRPRGAGPPSRSGRCGCATRRSAAP